METNKIIQLVKRLSEKSAKGELDWEQTDKENTFQLAFPNYSVRIMLKYSNEIPDEVDYYINIYNQDGSLIERTVDYELKNYFENSFLVFKDIFENARRKAMGVDKALDDILNALGNEDIDGPMKKDSSDDDLPF